MKCGEHEIQNKNIVSQRPATFYLKIDLFVWAYWKV